MQVTRKLQIMCGGVLVALLLGFAASAALSRSQQAEPSTGDPEVVDLRGQRWRLGMIATPMDRPNEFRFEVELTNVGPAVQQLSFDNQDQIAVVVRDAQGLVVWRDGGPTAHVQISRTVAPRSGIVYPILWDASDVPAGDYEVEARILSSDLSEAPLITTEVTVPQ